MSFNKIRIFYLNYYFIHIKDRETSELDMPSYLNSKFISIFMCQVILVVNLNDLESTKRQAARHSTEGFLRTNISRMKCTIHMGRTHAEGSFDFLPIGKYTHPFLPSLHCFPHMRPASSGCQHGLEMSSSPKNPPGPQQQAGGDSQHRGLSNPGFSASPVWNSH